MFTTGDPVTLTQELVRLDTSANNEDCCSIPLARTLEQAGLDVALISSEPDRTNLVATWRGGGRLVFAAHVDTVPFDADAWSAAPLSGEITDDRIYGRGTSDMKGGLAAMVVAACDAVRQQAAPFTLVVTIGEETGCRGARDVLSSVTFEPHPVIVIGESTGNALRFGHKGATWLRLTQRGRAAHGSRPELGGNAVTALSGALNDVVAALQFPGHTDLGEVSVNVGTFAGGTQPNIVPDLAVAELDVRTVPGVSGQDIVDLAQESAPHTRVETILDLDPIWSDPLAPVSQQLLETTESVTGRPHSARGVSYFSDASVLCGVPGSTAYLCGPGGEDEPHTANESCGVDAIRQATDIYRRLIDMAPALRDVDESMGEAIA